MNNFLVSYSVPAFNIASKFLKLYQDFYDFLTAKELEVNREEFEKAWKQQKKMLIKEVEKLIQTEDLTESELFCFKVYNLIFNELKTINFSENIQTSETKFKCFFDSTDFLFSLDKEIYASKILNYNNLNERPLFIEFEKDEMDELVPVRIVNLTFKNLASAIDALFENLKFFELFELHFD